MARPEPPQHRYRTLAQSSIYTGFSEKTIRRRIADGSLTAYRLGRGIRIDLDELERLMAQGGATKRGGKGAGGGNAA